MTEVLCPSQLAGPKDSDFPEPSVEWFLPQSYHLNSSAERFSGQDTHHASPSPIGSRGGREGSLASQAVFSSSQFGGLGHQMSHSNNPFGTAPLSSAESNSTSYPAVTASTSAADSNHSAFTPIAPDPVGLQRIQASRLSQEREAANEAYQQTQHNSKKRRATTSSMETPAPPQLREEDKLLLQLKDEQQLAWKDIATKFQSETGKAYMIPALQMRYKRLKERLQVWTEADVEALRQAHEYWESKKFDIISAKMLEFGATEKFSPRACQKRWQEMNPSSDFLSQGYGMPSSGPSFSQSASPQPPMQQPFAQPLHRAATYHTSPSYHHGQYNTPSSQSQQSHGASQGQSQLHLPTPLSQTPVSFGGTPGASTFSSSPRRMPTYPPAPQGAYWTQ